MSIKDSLIVVEDISDIGQDPIEIGVVSSKEQIQSLIKCYLENKVFRGQEIEVSSMTDDGDMVRVKIQTKGYSSTFHFQCHNRGPLTT